MPTDQQPSGSKIVFTDWNCSISDESTRYWDAGNQALNVETTAYALLAQMAVGRLKLAGPIVTWLTSQRDPQGGFVSTQVCFRNPCHLFVIFVIEC